MTTLGPHPWIASSKPSFLATMSGMVGQRKSARPAADTRVSFRGGRTAAAEQRQWHAEAGAEGRAVGSGAAVRTAVHTGDRKEYAQRAELGEAVADHFEDVQEDQREPAQPEVIRAIMLEDSPCLWHRS